MCRVQLQPVVSGRQNEKRSTWHGALINSRESPFKSSLNVTSKPIESPGRILHCNAADSVLAAIESAWRLHHAKLGRGDDFYLHVAGRLLEVGMLIDTVDGLEILEHCRKHDLPIADVLHTLDARAREAGYRGGPLNLGDCAIAGQLVYVFYDSTRLANFADVRALATMRLMPNAAALRLD